MRAFMEEYWYEVLCIALALCVGGVLIGFSIINSRLGI